MTEHDLKIPYFLVAGLSVIALASLPYGFYMFLKIAVTACAGTAAYLKFLAGERGVLVWIFVALAILFNPIIPVHLTKEIWMFFNIVSAVLFTLQGYKLIKGAKDVWTFKRGGANDI